MEQVSTLPSYGKPAVYRSLALSALLQQLEPERKYLILDLGRACNENIGFWSYYCPVKIYIPDFFRSLVSSKPLAPDDGSSWEAFFEQLIPCEFDRRFDIILAWDLFNYLEHHQLECLVRHLGRVSHAGTCLFALLSTLQQIPSEPTHFRILDREHLIYENNSRMTKPSPRYQPRDVKLLMAGFEVLVSFLLRHGVQEYLFMHRAQSR